MERKKTHRTKTNNQELLIRKENGPDATSRWIEFQKTSLTWGSEWKMNLEKEMNPMQGPNKTKGVRKGDGWKRGTKE